MGCKPQTRTCKCSGEQVQDRQTVVPAEERQQGADETGYENEEQASYFQREGPFVYGTRRQAGLICCRDLSCMGG